MLNFSMPTRTIVQCGLAAIGSALVHSWLHIRPLGIVFLILFCLWFYKTRCNLRLVPPPELQKKYEQLLEFVHDIRQQKPTMFCAIASGCLGTLAILGHLISGSTVVVMGLVVAALVSTKYNFKIIRIEPKDFAWSDKINHDTEYDAEFMPDVNEKNFFLFERASDLATAVNSLIEDGETDDKSDDIPCELLPESIPEILDNSTDEDDDLLPIVNASKLTDSIIANSETNKIKNDDVIEFKKGHFKRDSSLSTTSSSSEESLSKGLQFPDHTAVDGPTALRQLPTSASTSSSGTTATIPHNQEASDVVALAVKNQTESLLANSSKIIPSLMTGIVQWSLGGGTSGANIVIGTNDNNVAEAMPPPPPPQRRVVTALDSSDESDFEILENEDFK